MLLLCYSLSVMMMNSLNNFHECRILWCYKFVLRTSLQHQCAPQNCHYGAKRREI